MPIVNINGVDIHYEQYGDDGPQLLVAHGLLGSMALMPRFGERIEEWAKRGVRVTAYDARGHGRSGGNANRARYQYSALARDMQCILRALGIERASVYGGSMGAGTAIVLALEHPELVEKLILMSPPPMGARRRPAQRTFGAIARLYRLFGPTLTARIVAASPGGRRAQQAQPKNDLRSFIAAQQRRAAPAAIRAVLFDEDLPLDRFGEITCPTLILTHPGDPVHPLESGEVLHAAMPHARLTVAPSATYWSENPDALTHVVTAFVKGEPIAAGLPHKVVHEHGGHPEPE